MYYAAAGMASVGKTIGEDLLIMEHFERKLESQQIYQGKILSLRCDKVELEDGRTAFREVIDHHGGVAILAVDDQDHILFVSQFRYAVGG